MTDTIKISRELRPLIDRVCELEQQHGGIRAAAKAIGIDPGYLSRLKDGYKTNPSDEVLSLLGLERSVLYRAKGKHGAVDLAYTDPEAQPGENSLHTVSSLIAGQAFNSLCRMLGGRWPEARMEQEAPEAYRFFMALLATPPADAADMGGQAGQEVTQQITIVQHLDAKGSRKALGAMNARLRCKVGHLERKIAEQCEELEILNKQLDRFRSQSHGIPALAEHERLSEELAQHRQQAGKLAEALRNLRIARSLTSIPLKLAFAKERGLEGIDEVYNWMTNAHRAVDEALAAWEKTSCGK